MLLKFLTFGEDQETNYSSIISQQTDLHLHLLLLQLPSSASVLWLSYVGSVWFLYQMLFEATVSKQVEPSMSGIQVLFQLSSKLDEPKPVTLHKTKFRNTGLAKILVQLFGTSAGRFSVQQVTYILTNPMGKGHSNSSCI